MKTFRFPIFVLSMMALAGVARAGQDNTVSQPKTPRQTWTNGQEVEITGTIWPSKGIGTKFYIKGEDGNTCHMRNKEIGRLKQGARIWAKGKVEYVHYPAPKNPAEQGAMELPQTLCYLNMSEFRILENP